MNAADLLCLAKAQGVDFEQANQLASVEKARGDYISVLGPRGWYKVLRERSKSEAKGTASRSFARKPTWTIAELGQAAQGLAQVFFDAALYHYACDMTPYGRLYRQLVTRAYHLQAERDWPADVPDRHGIEMPYIRHLALMVLDEDQAQPLFKLLDGRLYSIYMNCYEKTWNDRLSGPYEDLRLIWLGWLKSATSHIGPRIGRED